MKTDLWELYRQMLRSRLFEGELGSKGEAERNVIIDSDKSVLYETYFRVVMAVTKAGGVVAIVDKKGKKE